MSQIEDYWNGASNETEAAHVKEVMQRLASNYQCLPDEMPTSKVACGTRPCDVLELKSRDVGECFSPRNLPCGSRSKLVVRGPAHLVSFACTCLHTRPIAPERMQPGSDLMSSFVMFHLGQQMSWDEVLGCTRPFAAQ